MNTTTKRIGFSALITFLILLFGCQSQPAGSPFLLQEPQSARLSVIQVDDMETLEAWEKAAEAQKRARLRADGLDGELLEEILAASPNEAHEYLAPYREAAQRGYSVALDGDQCRAYVRAGAGYSEDLGRAVAACLEAQSL